MDLDDKFRSETTFPAPVKSASVKCLPFELRKAPVCFQRWLSWSVTRAVAVCLGLADRQPGYI